MQEKTVKKMLVGFFVGCMLGCCSLSGVAAEDLESAIEILESEKAELEAYIEQLESENAELEKKIEELENETEVELETEIIGVTYNEKSIVQIVQTALNDEGFNCGTPDGLAGSKTTEAIKAYQKEVGINVNGVITDELLEALDVADKVDEAAKLEASKAEYSTGYTYEQLARNPEAYEGDKIKFSGKVLQAESGDICYARVAINSDYDTVIFITYSEDVLDYRLLEDDYITIYGESNGVYTYEAVSGATITIPWLSADIIDMN